MATVLKATKPQMMPDGERVQMILAAAERVFGAFGYGDATMEEVARDCGMAKKTVYRFFPDKVALFTALIASHEHPDIHGSCCEDAGGRAAPVVLRTALLAIARFVLHPRQLLMTRLVIADGGLHPELSEQFYRDCILKTHDDLARLLAPHLPQDVDPIEIADILIGMSLGGLHLRALMTGCPAVDMEERLQARVSLAVDAILALVAGKTR
jgi:TetR/AcrR family transcriptional regulator, mexJK operon transcriptional repressor